MRTSPIVVGLSFVFAAGAFACSGDNGASAKDTGDGGITEDGSSANDGGPITSDAASNGDAGAASDPANIGSVFVLSDRDKVNDQSRAHHSAGAYFARRTSPDTTVTTKTVGPCIVDKFGNGDEAKETPLSAGKVHVTGGAKTIELAPAKDKSYETASADTALWSGGETLKVVGDGSDVPAFSTSLVAPSVLTITAPAMPNAAGSLAVTRNTPFSVTWSGQSSGVVVLHFAATTDSNAFSATCSFDANAGTGTVPAAAFAEFPAVEGSFDFYAKEVATASAPLWSVRFTASTGMTDANGVAATGYATYQ